MASIVTPTNPLPSNPIPPKEKADLANLMAAFAALQATVEGYKAENAKLQSQLTAALAKPTTAVGPTAKTMPSGSIYVLGGDIYPAVKASKATWETIFGSLKDSIEGLYAEAETKAKRWKTLTEEQKCAEWEAYAKRKRQTK